MLRSAAVKVMWVGRATVFLIGLSMILALLFGVATTALGASGGNFILGKANTATTASTLTASVAGPALQLVNRSTEAAATALNISVATGKPPIKVNAAAGTATGLSADELDGKDSNEVLPLTRSQKDALPFNVAVPVDNNPQANSVSITAPTDGVLLIFANVLLYNMSTEDHHEYYTQIRRNDFGTAHAETSTVAPGDTTSLTPHAVVPVSAGRQTVTFHLSEINGSGNWGYDANNLTVMFVPAGRGTVSDTP